MADARWVEVSLTVRPELAESVAEVLSRYIPQGVALEQKAFPEEVENQLEPAVRVFAYLMADDALETRKRQIEEALWHLGQIQPLPPATFTPIPDEDWMSSWKEHFQPFEVGKRLVIIPAWMHKKVAHRNQVILRIQPGMAFGTGTHPSTHLCLELLEGCIRGGETVIDLGCGTGILAIAALRLGASHALALDNDPAAVQSAEEHALLNRVQDRVTIMLGSLKDIQEGLTRFVGHTSLCDTSSGVRRAGFRSDLHGQGAEIPARRGIRSQARRAQPASLADLVLVNILSSTILNLLQQGLADLVSPGGQLITSGLLESQAPEIITAAQSKGLTLTQKRSSQDWVALLLTKA